MTELLWFCLICTEFPWDFVWMNVRVFSLSVRNFFIHLKIIWFICKTEMLSLLTSMLWGKHHEEFPETLCWWKPFGNHFIFSGNPNKIYRSVVIYVRLMKKWLFGMVISSLFILYDQLFFSLSFFNETLLL